METPSSQANSPRETLNSESSFFDQNIQEDNDEASPNSVFIPAISYATIIAGISCFTGVGIFCGTIYRNTALYEFMLDQVFDTYADWVKTTKIVVFSITPGMGALTLIIIYIGFLTTEETQENVYRTWKNVCLRYISSRTIVRIIYILQFFWIFLLSCLTTAMLIISILKNICTEIISHKCIDLSQNYYLFPQVTFGDYKICKTQDIQLFCKIFVEKSELYFVAAGTFGVFLIIISLMYYMMCLSTTCVHINGEENIDEFEDIYHAEDLEFGTTLGHYRQDYEQQWSNQRVGTPV